MTDILRVKSDLKKLKKAIKVIDSVMEAENKHIKRLELLKFMGQDDFTKEEIERTERILESLNASEYIKEANRIEEKYMSVINTLEPLDKTIILDGYINGNPYWKIGMRIGYSEEGVRKRVAKIVKEIAEKVSFETN